MEKKEDISTVTTGDPKGDWTLPAAHLTLPGLKMLHIILEDDYAHRKKII